MHMPEPPFSCHRLPPLLPLPVSLSIHLCMLVLGIERAGDIEEEETWRKRKRREEERSVALATRH